MCKEQQTPEIDDLDINNCSTCDHTEYAPCIGCIRDGAFMNHSSRIGAKRWEALRHGNPIT